MTRALILGLAAACHPPRPELPPEPPLAAQLQESCYDRATWTHCEISLAVTLPCHDCNHEQVAKTAAFDGGMDPAKIWRAYTTVVDVSLRKAPFAAALDPQSAEIDEVCYVRSQASSEIVTGWEDVRYCFRLLPMERSSRRLVRMEVDIEISANPSSAYHAPDTNDRQRYLEVARQVYVSAISDTCRGLGGTMQLYVCLLH